MTSRNNDTSSNKPKVIEIPVQHFNTRTNEATYPSNYRANNTSYNPATDYKYDRNDKTEQNYEQNRNLNYQPPPTTSNPASTINHLINSSIPDYNNNNNRAFNSSPYVSAYGNTNPGSIFERPSTGGFDPESQDTSSRSRSGSGNPFLNSRPNRKEFSIPIVHENQPPAPNRPDSYKFNQENPSYDYKGTAYNLDNNNNNSNNETRTNYPQNHPTESSYNNSDTPSSI
jgi:hypothetical protein